MAWSYGIVCLFDFLVAPVFWSVMQVLANGEVSSQWQPITLQGAGLYHIAMGAICGVTAWSRGQEKMAGVAPADPKEPGNGFDKYGNPT